MSNDVFHIAATGCCLMDYLYTQVDFTSPEFQALLSKDAGDGGLRPGALVFSDGFEAFCGAPLPQSLEAVTGGRAADVENLGGPAVVALVHAAQMLYDRSVRLSLHAGCGLDETGQRMRDIIAQTPVDASTYIDVAGPSPSTVVLSDPAHHDGAGERTFINSLGTAGIYAPDMLDDRFYEADICLFGATALVPRLHEGLGGMLAKAKSHGALTVVGTAYDFRNEQRHPDRPWPLGQGRDSLALIDVLVCDREEALRISACADLPDAIEYFLDGGVGSIFVTHGAESIHLASRGGVFSALQRCTLPISSAVSEELAAGASGDTTGCGDNFLGGVLTSLASQMLAGTRTNLDMLEACAWGAASGGFACFYTGGTFMESAPGTKRERVARYHASYLQQIRDA